MKYLASREWPPISYNAADILNLFGPASEPFQKAAQTILQVNQPILGCDLEYNEPERYKEVPTILGVSDGALTVSVPFDEGLSYFEELIRRFPNVLYVGHAFTSADVFAFKQVGIEIHIKNVQDTIIWHTLTNSHLNKTISKTEDGDGIKKGKGYMNLWTFISLYTSLPNWKECVGEENGCDGKRPCWTHNFQGYNAVDSLGPVLALPNIVRQARLRRVDKLYDLHRDLAYDLAEAARYGVQTDREYLFGENGLQREFERQKKVIEETLPFNPGSNKAALVHFKEKGIVLGDWQEGTIRAACEEYEDDELHACLDWKDLGAGTSRWFEAVHKDKSGNWKGYMDGEGKIHPRLGFFCVDDETECLTQRGWKKRQDLIIGELAASFSLETRLLCWEPIKNIHVFPVVNEPMIKIMGRSVDMLVTKNHRCVVMQELWKKKYKPIVRIAEELRFSDRVIAAAPWEECGSTDISVELAELIGWYVAEGWPHEFGNLVEIYQSETANPEKVHRIDTLLTALGSKYEKASYKKNYKNKDKDYLYVAFQINGFLAAKLRELCPNKSLPVEVLSWEGSRLKALLYGFLQGDGTKHGKAGWTLTQKAGAVQDNNVDILHAIAFRCGLPCVKFDKRKNNKPLTGIHVNSKSTHRITREKRRTYNADHPYDIVSYSGNVWCPEMNNTTWVMRRNGYVCVTGNTSTGRMNCVSPNLQNLSARRMDRHNCVCGSKIETHPTPTCAVFKGVSVGKLVRRAIIASPGWYLIEVDENNAENRTFLHQAGHTIPLDVDGHTQTGEFMKLTPDMEFVKRSGGGKVRQAAKTISHGSFYCEGLQLKYPSELHQDRIRKEVACGAREVHPNWIFEGKVVTFTGANLAQRVYGDKSWVSRAKANEMLQKLFNAYPGARKFQQEICARMEREKAITTVHGYFLQALGDAEGRMKTCAAMHGSNPVAHFTKLGFRNAMVKFRAGRPMRPILQVHDSILCEVRDEVPWQEARAWAKEFMEAETLEMPGFVIPTDFKYSLPEDGTVSNWRDMIEVKGA